MASDKKPEDLIRQERAKSTMPESQSVTKVDEEVLERKKGSSLLRLSLSFIPGHGKKYSTYDTRRSYLGTSEGNIDKWNSNDIKTEKADQVPQTPAVSKRKKESQKSRPISESVSDFLLLNVTDNKSNETGSDHVEIVRKKGKLHAPKLPASSKIGKMLSHLEVKGSGSTSKSLNSLVDVSNNSEADLQKRISEIEKDIVPKPVQVTKSEDTLAKRASEIGIVHRRSIDPIEDLKQDLDKDQTTCSPEPQEAKKEEMELKDLPVEQAEGSAQDELEESGDKKNKGKKSKDPTRRKSGLAMLKQFFQSAKTSIKRKGEKSDRLSVTPNRSRKSSKDEKSSARSSLNMDSEQQQILPTNPVVQKEPSPCVIEPERIPKVTFQRCESHISEMSSEDIQSVREENFVAEKVPHYGMEPQLQPQNSEDVSEVQEKQLTESDYTNEARFVEVCEPESVPQVECTVTVIDEPSRKSINSVSSLEKLETNEMPVDEPINEEVIEVIPTLPIKMKTKCPSPGYDVPRSQPIPIEVDVLIKNSTMQDSPVFDSCEELKMDKSPGSVTPPTSLPSTTLVRKLSQLEIEITEHPASNKNFNIVVPRNSQTSSEAHNRLSFALATTESVDEEMVQILQTESLHSP